MNYCISTLLRVSLSEEEMYVLEGRTRDDVLEEGRETEAVTAVEAIGPAVEMEVEGDYNCSREGEGG